ncbi:ribulose bisphosphate carboxylase small subunit [Paraburkholderia kururiensis]|uniref:Ribulose bisphosphate carboxylase small subunit n=1 Tax=Paraburkholderia kururiensis TaxID=984307 RepID=A0ABZ0WMI0_9BURK|nr:ribulose bisphosphate carboxylase small subunit [Paraburkholderia kururiensis]WQD78575.1 ribulose bisphosphate carboxylase small subunit [Paraburkholderia kururiensis]
MRITQGTFSFLPELTDEEISAQINYALGQGWACSVEYTDDPHPRNTYWDMWGLPMFDLRDAAGVMQEVKACRATFPRHYIKVNAFDSVRGFETMRLSFIVNRPPHEPGFRLTRQEAHGRVQRYVMASYAGERPEGERYGAQE